MEQIYDSTNQARQSLMFFESDLFKTVQISHIFTDSKTFADAIPRIAMNDILNEFNKISSNLSKAELLQFIANYFELPEYQSIVINNPSADIDKYIDTLWGKLEKAADKQIPGSLLPLNGKYIVPGGRFREIYYWDSYFTALGLIEANKVDIVESMFTNFVDLQKRYGCIPNGNRSYYLSRSQPPILGLMLELLLPFQDNSKLFLAQHLQAIETEYQFWMQGNESLSADNSEFKRVVKMPNGCILNRYWDDSTSPRPESYCEDMELMNSLHANQDTFFRHIRAACESGWDFSSRWLSDINSLASINTTNIVPVDLNCLLYKLEKLLSEYHSSLNNVLKSNHYEHLAETRKTAINQYMWCPEQQFFFDYNIKSHNMSSVKSLAATLPLYVQLASQLQADSVSNILKNEFLKVGGLVTTVNSTEQQWDAPNGWAPLQWFATQGLSTYHHDSLANDIKQRWMSTIETYFTQTGKLMEKYNVCQQTQKAEGGEYDVQEGFGWTNGVYLAFKKQLKAK
mgnify:FL=1|tara:strand:- start:1503 stop:3041 length:1539 start_codon:yes stop_codon:yes gene_type:complete